MAAGDPFIIASASINDSATQDIKTPSGTALVTNIECGGAATIYRYVDGSNDIPLVSIAAAGLIQLNPAELVSDTYYLVTKNTSGGAADFGANGRYIA